MPAGEASSTTTICIRSAGGAWQSTDPRAAPSRASGSNAGIMTENRGLSMPSGSGGIGGGGAMDIGEALNMAGEK